MCSKLCYKFSGLITALLLIAIGTASAMANQYPSTGLTEYHYTNTWMSGSDTNKLIFYSGRSLVSGMRMFEVIVKNQTDETFNEARHFGTGWVGAGAEGWSYEINHNTNFLRFYNGHLGGGAQQVFIDGSSLTQANQVAIVPFEMDNNEGGGRTGYVLGPQIPESATLALLLIGVGLIRARREK